MVKWRALSLASLLMALGFLDAVVGILGVALFVAGAGKFRRYLIPVAVIYGLMYALFRYYTGNVILDVLLALAMLVAIVAASLRLYAVLQAMSAEKRNRLLEWGGKTLIAGAAMLVFYIGVYIMAIGFVLIALGALKK